MVPVLLALLAIGYKYLTAERFTNPETGATARVALSREQEASLGLQSFQSVLAEEHQVTSGSAVEQVQRVVRRLIPATGAGGAGFEWQAAVIDSSQVNAFCLPGGKIAVYTGILPVAVDDAGLATVLGHEMAHATSRHGAQRMEKQEYVQLAMMGAQGSVTGMDYQQQRMVMGLLGAGAQVGVSLPFSRGHESEADHLGLLYMARAGYDPHAAIAFWKRMAAAAGGAGRAEFLSTHPADATRVRDLEALLPQAMVEYEHAHAQ